MARPALPVGTGTRVFSGARALFIFNGEVVGFASGISGSEEIQYEPVNSLDFLEVREHVPISYTTSLSAQVFMTVSIGNGNSNTTPGSLKEQQIFPSFNQIFRVQGVTVLLKDDANAGSGGKVLEQWTGVKTASRNFNVTARGIVGQNVSFVAIKLQQPGVDPT